MSLPSYTSLEAQHPTGTKADVATLIKGDVGQQITQHGWDTCCVRISRALNYAGAPIPPAGGGISNPYMADHKIHTYKGGDNRRYIFNTYDMRAYLTGRYGHPKQFPGTATAADLPETKGIIAFHWFHIDLWDGATCHYLGGGCFGAKKVANGHIWLWPTP